MLSFFRTANPMQFNVKFLTGYEFYLYFARPINLSTRNAFHIHNGLLDSIRAYFW